MFATIKYKANVSDEQEKDKILYVNPDCAVELLLTFLRNTVGIAETDEFDLCDEFGGLQNVNDHEPQTNATEILQPRAMYIIVLIERNDEGALIKLKPLITNFNKKRSEMSLKLKRYINPSKRFTHELKKARRSSDKTTISTGSQVSKITTSRRKSANK